MAQVIDMDVLAHLMTPTDPNNVTSQVRPPENNEPRLPEANPNNDMPEERGSFMNFNPEEDPDLPLDHNDHFPLNNARCNAFKDLVFSPYYYVLRHSRILHRSEVMGFGFVSLTIICIALLTQAGLEAVGFFVPSLFKFQDTFNFPSTHNPHSFSWKMLSEFFISDSISNAEKECLYMNKKRAYWKGNFGMEGVSPTKGEEPPEDDLHDFIRKLNTDVEDSIIKMNWTAQAHVMPCVHRTRIGDPWTWFYKYMFSMFLPILNLTCSIFLLSCVRCRRRKGFQFTLMIPTFLSVFISVFQQVPLIFQYSYTALMLTDEMNTAATMSSYPILLSPIWEETQYHGQCCGIHSSETWDWAGMDIYPSSCCNRTAHSCEGIFPSKSQVWKKGCYKQEFTRTRYYEFYTLIIYLLKLVSEMGILWCLSDLTRYDYPRPEQQHNSTCDVKDFKVRTKGCAQILGVTEGQEMAIKLKKFHRKYAFRPHVTVNCKIIDIRNNEGTVEGTIEIRRERRNRDTEQANVDLRRARQEGLVFLSF